MINTMEINPDELAGLDLFQNCRLCLAKEKVSVDIFSDGAEVRLLYYKIISCLPVQVTQEDDKLPKKICMTCNEKVDTFYQFWTLTAKTQKTLIDWAQQKDVITTKIKTENVPPGEMSFKQETIDYSDDNDNDDHYDDDNSDDDVEPSAIVKVCEETDEAGTSATAHIKSLSKRNTTMNSNYPKFTVINNIVLSEPPVPLQPLIEHDEPSKPFKCSTCNKTFKMKTLLKKHLLLHSSERPFCCNICKRCFKLKNNLTKHMVMHTNSKPYVCKHCDNKCFKRSSELLKHDQTVHQGKKYNVHKKYKCNLCSKAFTFKQALDDHQYVHTGIKQYQCNTCGTALYSNYNLKKHMKTHDKQYNNSIKSSSGFTCHICGASFSYSQSYKLHLRTIHGDAKPKCPICDKIVCSKKFLESHINTHTGEKPFCCEYCGRAFTSKNYLKIHVRGHTGETPFKCKICVHKGFKQRSALTGHYKSNHPGFVP